MPNSAVASEDEVAEILAEFDEANEDMVRTIYGFVYIDCQLKLISP